MLSIVKSLNKIENLQKRALRFMPSDYESSHDEPLRLSGSCAINVRLKRNLCVEIYKTLNEFNPSFMREILRPCSEISFGEDLSHIETSQTYLQFESI